MTRASVADGTSADPELGAVVLAGGKSSRMGRDKAALLFEGKPLLVRVVATVSQLAGHVVVVAASEQVLPDLPREVIVVRDQSPYPGPLAALAIGLARLPDVVQSSAVVAVDMPHLNAAVLRRLHALSRGFDAAVAVLERPQSLAAIYRRSILPEIHALLARGEGSMRGLLATIDARLVSAEELLADPEVRAWDPQLRSFRDLDTPLDLERA